MNIFPVQEFLAQKVEDMVIAKMFYNSIK